MLERELKILEKQTVNRYGEIADAYSSDWRGQNDQDQLSYIQEFEHLLGSPPKKILDSGCGTGKDSLEFSADGYTVVSLDLSEGMLAKTIENATLRETAVNPLICNMRQIGIVDESVDGVWSMASMVHLSNEAKRETIQEFNRVLKPEGFVHIGVQNILSQKHLVRILQSYLCELGYNEDNQFYIHLKNLSQILSDVSLIERIRRGYAYLDNRHWFFPTKRGLMRMLEKEGFCILKSNHAFERRLRIFAQKQSL